MTCSAAVFEDQHLKTGMIVGSCADVRFVVLFAVLHCAVSLRSFIQVRGILTSNDLLGVAAAMSGRKSAGRGGLNGLSGWNGGLSREHSNTSSPTNSLTSSYGSVATNDSFDTKMYDAELLKTETREANLMQSRNNAGGDGGGPQFSPLQRKMRRTQQSFIEDRRRNNHETNRIRSKSKER